MPDLVRLDFPDTDLFILKSGDWQGFRSNACKKEPETVEWIRSFEPESSFWDVGASVGPYTLIAAALGYHVTAFEPFLPSAGELQQNVWLNEFGTQVDIHPTALGAFYGWEPFKATSMWPGAASHGQPESAYESFVYTEVARNSLLRYSDLVKPPTYVKVDVDGFERDVIDGGMWDQTESLMIESEPGTIEDVSVILASYGLTQTKSWPRMGETRQKNYLFERGS